MRKLVLLLIAITVLIACNNKSSNAKQEKFERIIQLDGQYNCRDLGNYSTTYGKTIKQGKIYRSGTLSQITESDRDIIDGLGIKTVVNFLTQEEIAKRGTDKLPQNT